jgi:hypothetical protein
MVLDFFSLQTIYVYAWHSLNNINMNKNYIFYTTELNLVYISVFLTKNTVYIS